MSNSPGTSSQGSERVDDTNRWLLSNESPVSVARASSSPSGGGSPSHEMDLDDVIRSYRIMLTNVADRLDEENIGKLSYISNLPSQVTHKRALEVLSHLDRRGEYSWSSIEPLKNLLKEIGRHDLANSLLVKYEHLFMQYQLASQQKRAPLIHQPYSAPSMESTPPLSSIKERQASLPVVVLTPAHQCSGTNEPSAISPPEQAKALLSLTDNELGKVMRTQLLASTELESNQEDEDWVVVSGEDNDVSTFSGDASVSMEATAKLDESITKEGLPRLEGPTSRCLFQKQKKLLGTHVTWKLQVKDLSPSKQKLSKKSFEVKAADVPRHKVTLNLSPYGSSEDFISLDVIVDTKFTVQHVPTLRLLISVTVDKTNEELVRHDLSNPLKSTSVPDFLSRTKLYQLQASTKIKLFVHATLSYDTRHT